MEASSSASPDPRPNTDSEEEYEYDGILPQFSDSEVTPIASTSTQKPIMTRINKNGKKQIAFSSIKKKVVAKIGIDRKPELSEKAQDKIVEKLSESGQIVNRDDLSTIVETLQIDKDYLQGKKGLMGKSVQSMGNHKFWATQPVTRLDTPAELIKEGPLEPNKVVDQVRQEPYELHRDFHWSSVDITNPEQLKEVYELLTHNYVEDDDASFRFDYSAEFLEWALKPPGYIADWHLGIRVAESNKLVGFISGVPLDLKVRAVTKRATEINLLCVHKKLRSKRFAPLLIKEITRRSHLQGIFQAIYTSGAFLPTPVTKCQYYHRLLNPKKLCELGFSSCPANVSMTRYIRNYKVSTTTTVPGLREMEKKDLKAVSRLLRAYLARMDLAPLLSNKDVEHALYAGRGKEVNGKRVGQVVWTFVIEDPRTKEITDMFSFYSLPSTATKAVPIASINAAYLFYYATASTPSTHDLGDGSTSAPVTNWKDESVEERSVLKQRLLILMSEALVLASQRGFDVLNAVTIQDNSLFFQDLQFGKGDGYLHFYLYNYSTKPIIGGIDDADGGSGVGLVML